MILELKLDFYRVNISHLPIYSVARTCWLTGTNYKQMVELHEKYSSKGLSILAFPSNQFKQVFKKFRSLNLPEIKFK